MKSNATAREEEVRRFPDWYIDSDGQQLRLSGEMRDAFRAHFRDRFARFDRFARSRPSVVSQLSRRLPPPWSGWSGYLERVWLLNAKSVMRWSRSAWTSRRDFEIWVCYTKCTWGCRICLSLFWRIFSTIGSPREPSLIALPRAWSHCWRKVASMFVRV